jgi:hypothetical protein
MPHKEILILAVTRMLGGLCTAGMTHKPDPVSHLSWVRPVREFGHVLRGDLTTAEGAVITAFDVVGLELVRPHPDPPHVEDWVVDFRHRPQVLRRLEGARRAHFLRTYLDRAPDQVLDAQYRSLALIRPTWVRGTFRHDTYTGKFSARLAFGLGDRAYRGSIAKGGLAVTDLKWRALGRQWLAPDGEWTEWNRDDLETRLGTKEISLAVGLSRSFEGTTWPIIVGVHLVPDYPAEVDYDNL